MAIESVSITPGSGKDIAVDSIGGQEFQVIKIGLGADGALDNLLDAGQQAMAASLPVAIASDQAAVPVSGTVAVTNAGTFVSQENGAALTALQLLADAIYVDDADWTDSTSKHVLIGGVYQSSPQTITDGDVGPLQLDANGRIQLAAGDSEAVIGSTSVVRVAIFDAGDAQITNFNKPATSGGLSIFRSLDLDETEEDVKTSAGQIYWIHAVNLAATTRYLKIYNSVAASVVVGTTTPVMTITLPSAGDTSGVVEVLEISKGLAFSSGICVAATTGLADNDTGAPGTNEVVVNIGYA